MWCHCCVLYSEQSLFYLLKIAVRDGTKGHHLSHYIVHVTCGYTGMLRQHCRFFQRKCYCVNQLMTVVSPIQAQSSPYLVYQSITISLIGNMILVKMDIILTGKYVLPSLPKGVYYYIGWRRLNTGCTPLCDDTSMES